MRIVKRLYTFMYQQFVPLLVMTFFICLFIVLMQFLWRYIDDLVGKGLSVNVIGELFFYAALSMVPQALPLAVLLASLMTFGNLGEKFELTALKAAGISLFQIMKPLIVLMVLIAIGAFFFQNDVLPIAQTKMYTLLFSMRQKSPEVEIPEKSFYDQIPGMNIYVDKKNPETGMLYGMILYDMSQGLDNSRVILADSGKFNFTEDKTHIFLHMYHGEMFENLRDNALGGGTRQFMPFRRESFKDKQLYMPFDANLNMIDEGAMRSQYIGKNVTELNHSIDSIQSIVDSIGDMYVRDLQRRRYLNVPTYTERMVDTALVEVLAPPVTMPTPLNIDSIFGAPTLTMAQSYINNAISKVRSTRDSYEFHNAVLSDQAKLMRRHGIELHRKFTLSFACLVFFFIGAPLGAIIKKGGIGTPLVISVFLFIFYYIIDNMGYKMARDGRLEVWQGIWLSAAVLLPLGIFLTYKAVGDSTVFNIDSYVNWLRRLVGKMPARELVVKELIMEDVNADVAVDKLVELVGETSGTLRLAPQRTLLDKLLRRPPLTALNARMEGVIDYLSNSDNKRVIALLNKYPYAVNYRNLDSVINISTDLIAMYGGNDRLDRIDESLPVDHYFRLSVSRMILGWVKGKLKLKNKN